MPHAQASLSKSRPDAMYLADEHGHIDIPLLLAEQRQEDQHKEKIIIQSGPTASMWDITRAQSRVAFEVCDCRFDETRLD